MMLNAEASGNQELHNALQEVRRRLDPPDGSRLSRYILRFRLRLGATARHDARRPEREC